jgi:hypothetical protein
VSLSTAFKRCLETLDVVGIRKLWSIVSPNAKRLREDEAEIALHMARTASESLSTAMRLYSHAFLTERGLPSQLPAHMLPEPPIVVDAVGISIRTLSGSLARGLLAKAVERAMSRAVMECYGDGVTDPVKIKARMMEARKRVLNGA